MTLYRSKSHRKRVFQYGIVAISTAALVSLGVVQIIKPIDYDIVTLEFEPIPQYKSALLDNLPENLEIEAEQGVISIFTDEESEMLMKIGKAEAGIDGIDGMCMVIKVVLNRIDSDKFPNTIEEVIYQESQFSSITDGGYDKAMPDEDCEEALELVLAGEYDWVKALYFENAESS